MKVELNNKKKAGKKVLRARSIIVVGLFMLFGGISAHAQIGLPTDPNIPDAPIDGFLTLGLIAGACIGLRRRIRERKD